MVTETDWARVAHAVGRLSGKLDDEGRADVDLLLQYLESSTAHVEVDFATKIHVEHLHLLAEVNRFRGVLTEIANEDYRGNRSPASQKAFQALHGGRR